MEIYSVDKDKVIKAYFLTGRITYQYALDHLVGLIDKLDIQRRFQNETFYKRLEIDFQEGCITPAITIAFIKPVDLDNVPTIPVLQGEITQDIEHAFVLDGIQRLNTLKRVAAKEGNTLNKNSYLYLNIIICPSRDNLLYRMVTLNNGQKPMTARHQIEILAESIYDFSAYSFKIFTEKENAGKNEKAYKKADILNSYISFLSNSTNLDNKKIIEDKLDELVARKIIESKIANETVDFNKILSLMDRMTGSDKLYNWLKNGNNLIGFCVGLRTSFTQVNSYNNEELETAIDTFEKAFKNINVSTIKLSRERRRLASFYISKIGELIEKDADELTLLLAEQI
ncbi:hypothetical protein [Fluviicola chungangensis]|uniref:DUF262 domain-containing protein n=1 Tax=Fluviicola chungangensis TaxID=2597671 RepID=A0A556N773_9FLAO|nr:hypothetical protein [Fluviicola chungangensis]TSJ48005.1 hypothetical protein FO442_02425 [Fluviicola chungangensis]